MNEPKEDTQKTNNDLERISIETLPETRVLEPKKSQTKEDKIAIPVESLVALARQDIGLKKIASADVNPLIYEIGPFPRRPQKVWVQMMGLHPVPSEGEPLVYDPSRNDFVRLVFTIVFIMLVCTCGICTFCYIVEPIRKMVKAYGLILMIVGIGFSRVTPTTSHPVTTVGVTRLERPEMKRVLTITMSYAFSCSACTRSFPCNFICLTLTVIGFSAMVVYFMLRYQAVTILLAIGTTGIIVLICLGLACTSFDFTRFALIVGVAMLAMSIVTLAYVMYCLITKEPIRPIHCALLIVGTLLHSVSLIIEFQMVIGGKTVELSTEDYAFGAFLIYSSIVTIFMKMMQLMGMLED